MSSREETDPPRPEEYSVLICTTVLFWERIELEAEDANEAARLAQEHLEQVGYDWSNSKEQDVHVTVELDGQVVAKFPPT